MNRTALLIALLTAYGAILGRSAAGRLLGPRAMDPFDSRPRAVEQLVVAGRFADALPLAIELQSTYPGEPLVSFWLATINHGLDRPLAEALAWGEYVRTSAAPAEACPHWAEAYTRAGREDEAETASRRCAELERR